MMMPTLLMIMVWYKAILFFSSRNWGKSLRPTIQKQMEISNKSLVVVENKDYWVRKLIRRMEPVMIAAFDAMYDSCSEEKHRLIAFQRKLQEVQHWNTYLIREQVGAIQQRCEYFSELLKAVFVTYIKMLTSVRLSKGKPEIRVKIPSNDTFVHRVYRDVAECFYNDPHIFKNKQSHTTKRQIIAQAIKDIIDEILPNKDILEVYMGNTVDEDSNVRQNEPEDDNDNDDNDDDDDYGNVNGNVHDNVHGNIHDNVHGNVNDNVHGNVNDNEQQQQKTVNIDSMTPASLPVSAATPIDQTPATTTTTMPAPAQVIAQDQSLFSDAEDEP